MANEVSEDRVLRTVRSWDNDYRNKIDKAVHAIAAEEIGVHKVPDASPISSGLDSYFSRLGDGSRSLEGLRTGLPQIDELIGGLNRFVLLAGTGGTGKSSLALQLSLGVIKHEQIPVLYLSYELEFDDVITILLQNLSRFNAHKLFRQEVVLRGNSPSLASHAKQSLADSRARLSDYASMLHVRDATDISADTKEIEELITAVKGDHPNCLVVVDSIQDLVANGTTNQAGQEALTAQRLVEIQQRTKCTILAISQKSKAGVTMGGYTSVLGSVAMVHKPTSVIEMTGAKELLSRIKDEDTRHMFTKLANLSSIPQPVFFNVLKGRNNGYGITALKYHGPHRYFEPGVVHDYNTEMSLYKLMGLDTDERTNAKLYLSEI